MSDLEKRKLKVKHMHGNFLWHWRKTAEEKHKWVLNYIADKEHTNVYCLMSDLKKSTLKDRQTHP